MSTITNTPTNHVEPLEIELDKPPVSLWSDAVKRLKKNKAAVISAYYILFVCIVAIFAKSIAPFSYETQNIDRMFESPNMLHLLGTDSLGRDMLSRIIYGARVSMAVGIFTAVISLCVGTLYGAIAGWFGGRVDSTMMRVIDILYTIPELVLLILVSVIFQQMNLFEDPELKALAGIFLALSLVSWAGVARLVRGQILQVREMLFIEAARAMGASGRQIIWRHIIPNIMGPVIVTLTFQIPANVLFESFLSFIGLGLQPPFSSWGVLANDGWRSLSSYPHVILFPGLVIFITMLAFNLFGDGLRDAFDPKMKNRG
jgi:oligopeptide transport system permease protein